MSGKIVTIEINKDLLIILNMDFENICATDLRSPYKKIPNPIDGNIKVYGECVLYHKEKMGPMYQGPIKIQQQYKQKDLYLLRL